MVPRPSSPRYLSPPMSVFGAALSMPLWRLALTAALIMAFAIAAADVSPASASSKVYPVPKSAVLAVKSRTGVYGPGIAIDSRGNRRVTGGLGLAHRFKAMTTSRVTHILFQPRWGSGYSAGDGGRYLVSIQTDDGTARHRPSGRVLSSFIWEPGRHRSGGFVRRFTFPRPPRLVKGTIYHVVWKNVHNQPERNYVSINETFTYDASRPRQPRYRNGIYAVLNGSRASGSGSSWEVDPRHTPNMDLVYANGKHQGMAYLGAMVSDWGAIGGSRMVREHFRVERKDRRVLSACVRVGRQRGTDPLLIRLERGDGREIESVGVPSAAKVAYTNAGRVGDNGDWVCANFRREHVLRLGNRYNLRLSAPANTQYSMTPILARDYSTDGTGYHMRSFHFSSGRGEKSTNGGRTWTPLYRWYPQNMQFYLITR
jgi:hypothetical protein